MKLESLVPKDKFDSDRVKYLYAYSFEELEPIIPSLLEWLQDGNWPVSRPVGELLESLPQDKLTPYIMDIMNGKDYEWKYFVIQILGSGDKEKLDPLFLEEIKRIAYHPTQVEIGCELDEVAQFALE